MAIPVINCKRFLRRESLVFFQEVFGCFLHLHNGTVAPESEFRCHVAEIGIDDLYPQGEPDFLHSTGRYYGIVFEITVFVIDTCQFPGISQLGKLAEPYGVLPFGSAS